MPGLTQFRPQALPDTSPLAVAIRYTNQRFREVASALAGAFPLVSGEVGVRDTDYDIGDIRRYGAIVGGTSDCGTAIANAIASLRALAATGVLFLPGGKIKTTVPLDLTLLQEFGIMVQGEGASQTGEDGGTVLLGYTGHGNPVIDTTGSNYWQLRDFSVYCPASGLSSIGLLQARCSGGASGERWNVKNVNIIMESRPAASARGTIAVYSCCGEDGSYESMWCEADAPWQLRETNTVISAVSPYQGTLTGPASMTDVQFRSCLASAFLYPAAEFEQARSIDCELSGVPLDGNTSPCFRFTGQCQVRVVGGQQDQSSGPWSTLAQFDNDCDGMTFDTTITAPSGALFTLAANVDLTACTFKVVQLGGTVRTLFSAAGTNTLRGSTVHVLNGQSINDTDLQLLGVAVFSDRAAAAVTVAASSTYAVFSETGLTLPLGGGTGLVSVGAADSGGVGFRALRVPN